MSLPIRQLARKIQLALEGELPRSEQELIAEEYASLCRRTNERLDQLSTLIAKGSLYSALHLAEVEPPVMDLVAQLSFSKSEEWRELCSSQRLPVAERLNESAVRQVRELYRNEMVDSSFLYREYRACILQKDEESALRYIRAIQRINADDKNAQEESMRLQEKHLRATMEQLEKSLAAGDAGTVLELMSRIESLPDVIPTRSKIWTEALTFRKKHEHEHAVSQATELESEIREKAAEEDYRGLLHKKKAWDQLVGNFSLEVSTAKSRELADLVAVAEREIRDEGKRKAQEAIADKLFVYLKELEPDLKGPMSPVQCREALSKIAGFRRDLLSEGATPDADLERRTSKVEDILRKKMVFRSQLRVLAIGTAVLVLIVGALVILDMTSFRKDIEAAHGEMEAVLSGRKLNRVERMLREWEQESSRFRRHPRIVAITAEAEERTARESSNQREVEDTLREITEVTREGSSKAGEILELWERVDSLWEELLPASQENLRFIRREAQLDWERARGSWINQANDMLQGLRSRFSGIWDRYLAEIQTPDGNRTHIEELGRIVSDAERHLALKALLNDSDPQEMTFWAESEVRAGQMTELLAQYDEGRELIQANRSVDSFRRGVQELAELPFSGNSLVVASRQVAETIPQWVDPSAALLRVREQANIPGGEGARPGSLTRFYPERLNSSENLRFKELFEDSVVGQLYRYDVHSYRNGTLLRDTEVIYAAGEVEEHATPSGHREEVVQEVMVVTPATLRRSPYYEKAVYMATRLIQSQTWQNGTALVNGVKTPESVLLEQVRTRLGYDHSSGRVGRSVLTALDDLVRNTEVDPIFRAWVYGELVQIALNRPEEWGILLAPAVMRDWERLQRLFGGAPTLSDWLDPNRSEQLRPLVRVFFQTPSVPSYGRQAQFMAQLASTLESSRWSYFGYVTLDGQIQEVATGRPSDGQFLWGLESFRRQWAPIFAQEGGRWVNRVSPQPLTPLFVFGEDLRSFVDRAAARINISDEAEIESLRGFLPVYFR